MPSKKAKLSHSNIVTENNNHNNTMSDDKSDSIFDAHYEKLNKITVGINQKQVTGDQLTKEFESSDLISHDLDERLQNYLKDLEIYRNKIYRTAGKCFKRYEEAENEDDKKKYFQLYLEVNASAQRLCQTAINWLDKCPHYFGQHYTIEFTYIRYQLMIDGIDRYIDDSGLLLQTQQYFIDLNGEIRQFCNDALFTLGISDPQNFLALVQQFQSSYAEKIQENLAIAELNISRLRNTSFNQTTSYTLRSLSGAKRSRSKQEITHNNNNINNNNNSNNNASNSNDQTLQQKQKMTVLKELDGAPVRHPTNLFYNHTPSHSKGSNSDNPKTQPIERNCDDPTFTIPMPPPSP